MLRECPVAPAKPSNLITPVLLALALVLSMVMAGGCRETPSDDPTDFIPWASDHAVPVATVDTPLSPLELEPLREAIGSARVVGLGESRHDTREQLLLKGLLVRHLVEDFGFRALVLEESFSHAQALDRYVTSGEGDPRVILNQLAGWYLWDTEEMLALFEWIRRYNQLRPTDGRVRIFGTDITAPAAGVRRVLDAFEAAGVETRLEAQDLGLELHHGDFWPEIWERYRALTEDRRRRLTASYAALVEEVQGAKGRLVEETSEQEYERLLRMSRIGESGNALFSSSSREEGGKVRERGMAETTLWILEEEVPGERVVLWAHNLHVATDTFLMPGLAEGASGPMGIHLREALGDAYLAVGGTFGTGTFPGDLPPGPRTFERPSIDVMDGALAAVGPQFFWLDLRRVDRPSGADRWLRSSREWRAQDASARLVPAEAFDLVYYVDSISRSRPTPSALRRFGALQSGD
jgi:erythromycin esterase